MYSREFFYFTLLISLFAPVAMAQDFTPPDKEHRQGMSYEEYSSYREKMRMRMEKMTPEERKQAHEMMGRPDGKMDGKMERPNPDSAYGQGFHTRKQPDDRPANASGNRADRPRVERFNRGERLRR